MHVSAKRSEILSTCVSLYRSTMTTVLLSSSTTIYMYCFAREKRVLDLWHPSLVSNPSLCKLVLACDASMLEEKLRGVDLVVHAAGPLQWEDKFPASQHKLRLLLWLTTHGRLRSCASAAISSAAVSSTVLLYLGCRQFVYSWRISAPVHHPGDQESERVVTSTMHWVFCTLCEGRFVMATRKVRPIAVLSMTVCMISCEFNQECMFFGYSTRKDLVSWIFNQECMFFGYSIRSACSTRKDLVSWNSMIFGYSQHGLAEHCLGLLKEMEEEHIVPDVISFLGILSSCRHACFVEEGRCCFKTMIILGIQPELDHYSCMVDLLGRAGLLDEAWDLIHTMSMTPNAVIWGSLLAACRMHGNIPIGIHAAEHRLKLEPGCAATHVQLANLYASIDCWSDVARVRKMMKERGLKTNTGCSWIEVGSKVYTFTAENRSKGHQVNNVLAILDCLQSHMESKHVVLIDNLEFDGPEHFEELIVL